MEAGLDTALTQLILRAQRDDETPESPSLLEGLPWLVRFAIAEAFVHIKAGEEVALALIRRISEAETVPPARSFALMQVRDEEQHVEFFKSAEARLGIRRTPMPELLELFAAAAACDSLAGLLFANQIVVETVAHELFRDVAGAFRYLAGRKWLPRKWRAVFSSLFRSVSVIFRDETRHVAFGVIRLRGLRSELSETQQLDFDREAREWGVVLANTLDRLPVTPLLRGWLRSRSEAILLQYRQRCGDIGVSW